MAREPRPGRIARDSAARSLAPLLVVAVLLVATGCGGSSQQEHSAWLPRYRGDVSGDTAGFRGILARRGNCLYVGDYLPVFPPDSQFSEKRGVLTVLGKEFRIGEQFQSGGGTLTWAVPLTFFLTPPDPSCDATHMWLVGDVT